jgi:hypothetical protein
VCITMDPKLDGTKIEYSWVSLSRLSTCPWHLPSSIPCSHLVCCHCSYVFELCDQEVEEHTGFTPARHLQTQQTDMSIIGITISSFHPIAFTAIMTCLLMQKVHCKKL